MRAASSALLLALALPRCGSALLSRGTLRARRPPRADPTAAATWDRPLGNMEKLLNAKRSWSGSLTTAHVSAAVLSGRPPTASELRDACTAAIARHPLLRARVVGLDKFDIPDAAPYALHDNYIGKVICLTAPLAVRTAEAPTRAPSQHRPSSTRRSCSRLKPTPAACDSSRHRSIPASSPREPSRWAGRRGRSSRRGKHT